MRHEVERYFPALIGSGWQPTSPRAPGYNCIAWAAGDSARWWWPSLGYFWPLGIIRDVSLDAFIAAFETLGYRVCGSTELEEGIEKVAIFAQVGEPKHAARQLPDGSWTSKLGKNIDIAHQLQSLEGQEYGTVAVVLARQRR